ncbi:hypothetical protein FRC07_012504 [Ceratobasidium sp. 392]|nr:hypothetical protein FRC07_012504 [Ceratobasidium sp. 392]
MAELEGLADLSYLDKARLVGGAFSDLFRTIYTIATTPTDMTGRQWAHPAPSIENPHDETDDQEIELFPRTGLPPPRLQPSPPPNPKPEELAGSHGLSTAMPGSWEIDDLVEPHDSYETQRGYYDTVAEDYSLEQINDNARPVPAHDLDSIQDAANLAALQQEPNDPVLALSTSPAPSIPSNVADVSLVVDPPFPIINHEPPNFGATEHQSDSHDEDPATLPLNPEVRGPSSSSPTTLLDAQLTPANSLNTPPNGEAHQSQDHLSVSSHGGASSISFASRWEKTSASIRMLAKKLKPKSSTPPTPSSSSASPNPRPSTHAGSVRQGKAGRRTSRSTVGIEDPELLSKLGQSCVVTMADLTKELAPLPFVGDLVETLKLLANGIEGVRTNKRQWDNLWHHCTVTIWVCSRQLKLAETDEEQHAILVECFHRVKKVVQRVKDAVDKWTNLHEILAFILYKNMGKEIGDLFDEIHRVWKTFSLGATGLELVNARHAQFKQVQEDESRAIKILHKRVAVVAKDIETIKDDPIKMKAIMADVEKALKPALQEYWKIAGTTSGRTQVDAHEIVSLILSLTGLSAPPAIFRGEACKVVDHEEIKHGRTCTVYRAKLPSGEEVAKKVFHIDHSATGTITGYAEKISRDAQVWYNFNCDYTLKFYGVGIEESGFLQGLLRLYMISPLMPNLDAITYLKTQRGSIGNKNILRIVMDAALGLQYIHSRGSVHSGPCGENILIRNNGRGVLGGFGLTKVARKPDGKKLPEITQTGTISSQRWMAPETFTTTDLPQITEANDVWAWAMTALEVISGEIPFRHVKQDSNINLEILRNPKIRREQYPTFETFAHQPDALWVLFQKCWKLEPAERPTMKAVVEELEVIYQM